MLPGNRTTQPAGIQANLSRDASAAFRDGLYLGKMAAKQGGPKCVASGRWSTHGDRMLFVAGYELGYHESVARVAAIGAARRSE